MTPQGAVIMVIVLVIVVIAFMYDKKKADGIRSDVDKRFEGKHVCDFKDLYYNGYIADNTLVLKERVKGYIIIDLTKVKMIEKRVMKTDGGRLASVLLADENGKQVEGSRDIKPMSPDAVDQFIEIIMQHANWIQLSR